MATNQFFPFATGAGALVLTNSQLQAMTALSTGFQQGVADPASVNSVWRQSASIAAMIAQFTADNQPNAVLDNGNIATLEAEFEAALEAYILSLDLYIPLIKTTTFFVNAATGSDTAYDGISATVSGSHGPWATIAHAVAVVSGYLSLGSVTISVAAGTYDGVVLNPSLISGWTFVTTGGAVTINGSAASQGRGFLIGNGVIASISGFAFGSCQYENINVQEGARAFIGNNTFSPPTVAGAAAIGCLGGNILSAGNATSTWLFANGSYSSFLGLVDGGIATLGSQDAYGTSTLVWGCGSGATVGASISVTQGASVICSPAQFSFTGTVTGPRFSVTLNGTINSGGGGVNLFPGSTAGTTGTGGQYL